MTFKDIKGHHNFCYLMGRTSLNISGHIITTSLSCTVSKILSLISQNLKEDTWPWPRPL